MNFTLIKIIDKYFGSLVCVFLSANKTKEKIKVPKKILLIKFFGIGNIVLTLPSVDIIRKKYPNAHIHYLTVSNNKGLLERTNLVNNVFYINIKNIFSTIQSLYRFIKLAKKMSFDIIVDFEQFSKLSAIITSFYNGHVYGFRKGNSRKLYSSTIVFNNNQHVAKTFSDLLKLFGIESKIDSLIPINTEIIKKNNRLIGMHPGSSLNNVIRRYPKTMFARLADLLIEKTQHNVIFTGLENEKGLIIDIIKLMNNKNKATNMAGKTDIPELISIISSCALFISNDTGPMHIAAAQGINCIGIFGPNTPIKYGPYSKNSNFTYKGLSCSPCIGIKNNCFFYCRKQECVKTIDVDDIIQKTVSLLNL